MAHAQIKSLISYLILITVFVTGNEITVAGLSIYWYYPVYVLFVFFCLLAYRKLNIRIAAVLFAGSVFAWFTAIQGPNLVMKQIANIIFSSLVFYNLVVHEDFDVAELIRKYVVVCKVILVIGFVQVIFFAIGLDGIFTGIFPFLQETNISVRFQSVTSEPSYIAFTFAPVVFFSVYKLLNGPTTVVSKAWAFLFLLGYWLTYSLTAYVGLVAMLAIVGFRNFTLRKVITTMVIVGVGVGVFSFLAYKNVSYIKERVDDTYYGVTHPLTDTATFKKVNLSTYAFLSNAYVTRKSLESHPWTGYGLGTHEMIYDKFLPELLREYTSLNRSDANSLAMRLITETGVIGFILFIYFVARYKIVSRSWFTHEMQFLWMVNAGIFVMILIALLRNGNYTVHGKMLFLIIYYYSARFVREKKFSSRQPSITQPETIQSS